MNSSQKSKEVASAVRQHARQLVRELDLVDSGYLDSGYTFSQCHLMYELVAAGQLNLGELAERLLIDKSNASRSMKRLVRDGLVEVESAVRDGRQKLYRLNSAGRKIIEQVVQAAETQVEQSLDLLSESERQTVAAGLQLYAGALRKLRLQRGLEIRPLQKKDNRPVADLIRRVMTEYSAVGEGYSIGDPEVNNMYANYQPGEGRRYLVIVDTTQDDRIVGGAGIGPLAGGPEEVCELRKMFFLPEFRGRGMGRRLAERLFEEARSLGYKQCYLETLSRMLQANELYRRLGFELLDKPLGNTGHHQCDCWYVRSVELESRPN